MITQSKNTEYVVTLETFDTDELGIGYERQVAVRFDDEVNWDNWLDYFNHTECEECFELLQRSLNTK